MAPPESVEHFFSKSSDAAAERAYDFVFRRYYPALCFFANRLLNNSYDAEDTVQDCFTKLWAARRSVQNLETVKSFLYKTVRNACIDRIRRNETSQSRLIDSVKEETVESYLSDIILAETLTEVYASIDSLPPRMGQVFRMFYLEGLNYTEIASHFDTSTETVRRQRATALHILRTRLKGFIVFLFAGIVSCFY